MQLLVLSDSHGAFAPLKKTIEAHPDVDAIIHCGDGEYEMERLRKEYPSLAEKITQVRGNCDHDTSIPLMQTMVLPFGHKLIALHGHRYMGCAFEEILINLAKQNDADMVLFGHIHARVSTYVDGVWLFNPGSLALPRDGKPASYGLIDILEQGILTSHGDA